MFVGENIIEQQLKFNGICGDSDFQNEVQRKIVLFLSELKKQGEKPNPFGGICYQKNDIDEHDCTLDKSFHFLCRPGNTKKKRSTNEGLGSGSHTIDLTIKTVITIRLVC